MSKSQRTFHLERLEPRELMAGDVVANVLDGNLYVNERPAPYGSVPSNDQVLVSGLADGRVRVTAAPGSGTLVNGAAYQDFTVPGSLFVNLGNGHDFVQVDGSLGAVPVFENVQISVGSSIGLSDFDTVRIGNLVTRGSLLIDTGAGPDRVNVAGVIGDGVGIDDLVINTGAGGDTVDVNAMVFGSIDIQTFSSLSENDVDNVRVWLTTVQSDLRLRLGGGDDQFRLEAIFARDDIDLEAGDGNDTGVLSNVTAIDDLMAHMGEGSDTLQVFRVRADYLGLLGDGGSGDRLEFTSDVTPNLLSGWEWINGRGTTATLPLLSSQLLSR